MEFPSLSPESPVLVIGAAGVDIVGRLKNDPHPGSSNPAQIRTSFGGVARNVAENLARLGQPVHLITAVGEDQIGLQLTDQLVLAGVQVEAVLRSPRYPTGFYIAAIKSSGERLFAMDDMRVISGITGTYLRSHADLFRQAGLLFFDANLSKEAMQATISLARKYGVPICADPTSAALAPKLRPYLPDLTLITPNSTEAGILCEQAFEASQRQKAVEAAKCLVNQGVATALITLAEYGVSYATAETSGYIPAIKTSISDPTGAGDALAATVLFGLLNQIPLDDAIRLGVTAATLTLRYPGSVVPDLSLENLYDQLVL